jgi:hypothetical protein
MTMTRETIDHATLERLVEAGAVRGANVVGQPGGWGVVIQYGMTERVLAAKRGAVRIFRKFETLAGYLRDVGIVRYQVDATQYDPAARQNERRREDAAERMKRAHEAAAYDDWLRTKVTSSREGIENGTNRLIEPDEWADIRARKRARAA